MERKRIVYNVVPGSGHGGWDVKKEGAHTAIKKFPMKGDAVHYGRELAKMAYTDGGLGQLKIHDRRGRMENEWTYGEDPQGTPG